MRPLSVQELLGIWERGLAARPCERALAILSAASPESSYAALARASIGSRDASLMRVREWAFGPDLAVLANCPRCHQPVEAALRIDSLRLPPDARTAGAGDSTTCGGYQVRCRPPNSEDLLTCAGADPDSARRALFACCVIEARRDEEPVDAGDLPEDVVRAVVEHISAMDPQADTRIGFSCPECGQAWSEVFDITSILWTEIDAWARRLLRDINVLARAYGWPERDILALSPVRRHIYLAMAQA